ncbi:hypothetical protein HYY73_05560 [Candidatus Woesearchaeota archaeon]|nr:hypothetical protein [Candidatus Woesearchaeota archaeon]
MANVAEIAAAEKKRIFQDLKDRRPGKYESVIRQMETSKWFMLLQTRGNVAEAFARAQLLTTFYLAMRAVDDVIDGDAPLPSSAATLTEYAEQRIAFAQRLTAPVDVADYLLLYSVMIGGKIGIEVTGEARAVLESMKFDAQRRDEFLKTMQLKFYPRKTLDEYFHSQDIKGTVSGMLKLFDTPPGKTQLLMPIGNAHRLYLTLKDFPEDLAAGLVNISQEDADRLGIKQSDLEAVVNQGMIQPNVRTWIIQTAQNGLDTLRQHREIYLRRDDFPKNMLGRVVLRLAYERPAKKAFQAAITVYS